MLTEKEAIEKLLKELYIARLFKLRKPLAVKQSCQHIHWNNLFLWCDDCGVELKERAEWNPMLN
jgi:hypothetical protein